MQIEKIQSVFAQIIKKIRVPKFIWFKILKHADLRYYFGEQVFAKYLIRKINCAKIGFELCKANNKLFPKYRLHYFDDVYYMKAYKRKFTNIIALLEPSGEAMFKARIKYANDMSEWINFDDLRNNAAKFEIIGKYCNTEYIEYLKNKGISLQGVFIGACIKNNIKIIKYINENSIIHEQVREQSLSILMYNKFYETYYYLMNNQN